MNKFKQIKNDGVDNEKSYKSLSNMIEVNTVKNSTDLIKKELDRYLKADLYEDQIWGLACDSVKNYKEYFPEGNSCQLEMSFSVEKRLEKLKKLTEEKKREWNVGSYGAQLYSIVSQSENSSERYDEEL